MKRALGVTLVALGIASGCGLNQNDPYFEQPVVSLSDAPPPIAGGTLLGTRDGRHAVLSDPDRHRIVVVELASREVRSIPVDRGVEPGRLVEDDAGRVYVALRAGGAVLAVDPATASLVGRYEVCAAPRGLAWHRERDALHVACADGRLMTLGPSRSVEQTVWLPPDLRDVVVTSTGLLVSRFRTAELLQVSFGGAILAENRLPIAQVAGVDDGGERSGLTQPYSPGVAVRLAPADDGALVLHQRARVGPEVVFVGTTRPVDEYTYSNRPVRNETSAGTIVWRDPCDNAVVHAALTVVGPDGAARHVAPSVPRGVVPVDVAVSPSGRVVLAFAGEPTATYARGPQVVSTSMALAVAEGPSECLPGDTTRRYPGQVVAVAFAGEVELVQLREPARLVVDGQPVELGGDSVRDTGHDIFHLDTGGAVACASCHPGGADDGHVWHFAATRPIRTLPLEGMIGLLPYHRDGSVSTFPSLMADLERQLDSPPLSDEHVGATRSWLARLPGPPAGPAADLAAIERGRAIFESAETGCASCHQGELGTDGLAHDIGGRRWQTPPLAGVALRPPYLNDGRASDLRSAILAHDGAAGLGAEQLADVEAYVRSR